MTHNLTTTTCTFGYECFVLSFCLGLFWTSKNNLFTVTYMLAYLSGYCMTVSCCQLITKIV